MDRGGSRLKWALTATGRLRWQIGREQDAFVLSVSGDHTPTWRFASVAEARAFVERIEGSAPIGEDAEGSDAGGRSSWFRVRRSCRSSRSRGPRATPSAASHCGSEAAPVLMKPLTYTITWWDDPEGRWICPDCDRVRASAANVR